MLAKTLLPFLIIMGFAFSSNSQVGKVKRKGVTQVDVTKDNSANTSSYSLHQFSGKWQEVERKDRSSNSSVSFTDTLFYEFSGDHVFNYDGVHMSMKGEAAVEPGNVLVAAADIFTIKSLTGSRAVLDDGDQYIHTLVKKKEFWHETLPSNAVLPEKFTTPISVKTAAIMGKWKVYRRDAQPGENNGKALINILNITSNSGDNTTSGEVTFYSSEKLETLPCSISLDGSMMHITTPASSWDVNVYKADGKDLVFGNPSLMYYCKQL